MAKTGTRIGRNVGWAAIAILFGLSLLFVAWDVMDYAAGNSWKAAPLGQRWFEIHRNSLLLVQPAIERHVAAWLWPPLQWLLEQPAALGPGTAGVVVALFKFVQRGRGRV